LKSSKLREGGFEEGMFAYREELDVRKAKKDGIQIGIEKALIQTAFNFNKMGFSVEKIKEILQEKGKKN